jgi:carboxymethylenebutenolidase
MARRIGTVGYYVILPNLYYREVREFNLVRDEAGMKQMFAHMHALSIEMIMRDTQVMLDYVDADEAADATRIGAVGYCMSGPFVTAAAKQYPERIRCAASIYGAGMVTEREDSPHRNLDRARGELYFACAEVDKYAPRETIDALEVALRASGANYRLEWYPGTEHGFAFPKRQGIFNYLAAERLWERLFSLFDRNLRAPG